MNTVLLNSEQHRDLTVDPSFRPEYGDNIMWSQTFAPEFLSIQAHYPILFQKDRTTGRFVSVALFGLEQNENLFLQSTQWQASYIPLMMQRIPFSIGRYQSDSEDQPQRMLHIDLDHPKVNVEQGLRLFEDNGATTHYLERVSGVLETIHHWYEQDVAFIQALTEHELLETVTVDVTLADGTSGQLLGFYTINEERLNALDDQALGELNRQGFLKPIYMVLASFPNLRRLIDLKSGRSAAA